MTTTTTTTTAIIRDWRTIEIKKKNIGWYPTKAIIDDLYLCGLAGCNRKLSKIDSKPQFRQLGVAFCSAIHYFDYLREHNLPLPKY